MDGILPLLTVWLPWWTANPAFSLQNNEFGVLGFNTIAIFPFRLDWHNQALLLPTGMRPEAHASSNLGMVLIITDSKYILQYTHNSYILINP